MESIAYALELNLLPDELRKDAQKARENFVREVFSGRHRWKPWAYGGLIFFVIALIAVATQGVCLCAK